MSDDSNHSDRYQSVSSAEECSSVRITALQTDIIWEEKQANLRLLHERLKNLCGKTEIVVLPETFSTGFSMNARQLAEGAEEETVTTLLRWAKEYQLALAGSYIACENRTSWAKETPIYTNRAFFLTPQGEVHYYDKRHLFRMGGERTNFTPGTNRPVITYRGWKILLQICYDLRFPVWSRNVNNEYDLLIYVANWPASRRRVWDVLLQARALENQCYLCGVNRIGNDGNGLAHNGGSVIYSPKGELLGSVPDNTDGDCTVTLEKEQLIRFRERFPVWMDADTFTVT